MAKNRTSFKKGQVANPKGRPKKGYSITETIKAMLKARPEVKKALGTKILEKALKGDMAAIKMLWQYMDGMPSQTMKMQGDEDAPLGVVVLPPLEKDDKNMDSPSRATDTSTPEEGI